MVKNLYITSSKPGTGKTAICLGLINSLKGIVENVGYFKPIGRKYDPLLRYETASTMMKSVYGLEDELEYINPISYSQVKEYEFSDRKNEFISAVTKSYKKVSGNKDVVIIDGIDYEVMQSNFEFDLNADLAKILNAGILLVENGHGRSVEDIITDVESSMEFFRNEGCEFIGTIINKVDDEMYDEINSRLETEFQKRNINYFGAIPFEMVLSKLRLSTIAKFIGAEVLFGNSYLTNIASGIVITAMGIDSTLGAIEEGSLIIAGGDQYDIILGCMASLLSGAYPNISGIIIAGGKLPSDNIVRLFVGLEEFPLPFSIPFLFVQESSFQTALTIQSMPVQITSDDTLKIEVTQSLFHKHVRFNYIFEKINVEKSHRRTPDMFKYEIIEMARSSRKRIVMPEGDEERTLKAVEHVAHKEIADIILLGNPDDIMSKARITGVQLPDTVKIINNLESEKYNEYVDTYYELRKHKHIAYDLARDLMKDPIYFGTMMVLCGDADGLVSGAVHTTQHTIRPAFELIKTKPGITSVSSIFFMCLKDNVIVYGDCAIIPKPSIEELADIAITSAETARVFGIEPFVAMLSYSSGESGKGPDVERVREATKLVRTKNPELRIEGPIQYDAAIDKYVASIKMPESPVAGNVNVFIFPDLNTGNNTYKAVQRASGAIAIGPVLQGLNKPVNDLSRGCSVEDIVYTIAITAIQAQNI